MGGTIGLISSMYSTTKLIVFTQFTTVQKLPYLCAVWCELGSAAGRGEDRLKAPPSRSYSSQKWDLSVASLARELQSGKKIGLSARIDRDDDHSAGWGSGPGTVGVVAQQRVPIIPPGPRC